jgi:hypothetical protein
VPPPPGGVSAIYNFSGCDEDTPAANIVFDASGNLYGPTMNGGVVNRICYAGCGVVFKLAPPASGSGTWTETY